MFKRIAPIRFTFLSQQNEWLNCNWTLQAHPHSLPLVPPLIIVSSTNYHFLCLSLQLATPWHMCTPTEANSRHITTITLNIHITATWTIPTALPRTTTILPVAFFTCWSLCRGVSSLTMTLLDCCLLYPFHHLHHHLPIRQKVQMVSCFCHPRSTVHPLTLAISTPRASNLKRSPVIRTLWEVNRRCYAARRWTPLTPGSRAIVVCTTA